MVPLLLWLGCVAASVWEEAIAAQPNPGKRDLANKDYFVVEVADPANIASQHNWETEEPFPITNHWLLSSLKTSGKSKLSKRELEDARMKHGVRNFYESKPSKLRKKSPPPTIAELKTEFNITDPLFPDQWHIFNPQEMGHDMNIIPVWRRNITGKGVTVAIVDDGLDYDHPDFAHTFSLEGSWDYNLHQQHPKPMLYDDNHGTRCAGEISAGLGDGVCGVGIAPDSKVAGIRILSGDLTKADEARSLIHQYNVNDIYSCSWGPEDNGKEIDGPSSIVRRAELEGIENGRHGYGSIYVVASGNGDYNGDNCNYDGYTNSIYSITVSAIDRLNQHPFYAESCSANMVVTYSSNYVDKITTTDRMDPLHLDEPKCTNKHSGTSAAAPIAAGVFALVLEQRPELTWRDLQYLARETAQKFEIVTNDHTNGAYNRVTNDWQITADGHHYHNSYGYGLLDADAIVKRAESWELVKPQSFYFMPMQLTRSPITPTTTLTAEVTEEQWEEANMDHLEHVRVRISYTHEQRGALHFQLMSPAGIVSDLALPRERDLSGDPVHDWEFLTVVHWHEVGAGPWKLYVAGPEGLHGVVDSWQLKFFGQAKDVSKVKRYSEVWNEYESDDVPVVHDPLSNPELPSPTEPQTPAEPQPSDQQPSEPQTSSAQTSEPSSEQPSEQPSESQSPLPSTTSQPSSEPSSPGSVSDDPSTKPPPGVGSHSIWYYLVASALGVVMIVLICTPLVYYVQKRRAKNTSYSSLTEQNIELDNFSDFEIDDDDVLESP